MKLTNSGEYMVNVFGVLLAPNDAIEGAECSSLLKEHPELVNSIDKNGLTGDADARKALGLPIESKTEQPAEAPVEKKK